MRSTDQELPASAQNRSSLPITAHFGPRNTRRPVTPSPFKMKISEPGASTSRSSPGSPQSSKLRLLNASSCNLSPCRPTAWTSNFYQGACLLWETGGRQWIMSQGPWAHHFCHIFNQLRGQAHMHAVRHARRRPVEPSPSFKPPFAPSNTTRIRRGTYLCTPLIKQGELRGELR